MHRVADRRERPAHVEQVVAQPGDALADLLRRPRVDAFLELVDLVVQRVDEAEVVLGQLVEEDVGDLPDGSLLASRLPRVEHGRGVERVAALGGLAHGDEPVARGDEVDLLVDHAVLVADAHRDQEDAEDVVAVPLDAGARLVVVARRLAEQLERPLVQLLRKRLPKLVLVRVEQVDPLGALGHPAGFDAGRGKPPRPGRYVRGAVSAVPAWPSCSASQRSASSAPMQPIPAAVIAWRYVWSTTSPAANTPSMFVRVEPSWVTR